MSAGGEHEPAYLDRAIAQLLAVVDPIRGDREPTFARTSMIHFWRNVAQHLGLGAALETASILLGFCVMQARSVRRVEGHKPAVPPHLNCFAAGTCDLKISFRPIIFDEK